jgi:hypothetical protein
MLVLLHVVISKVASIRIWRISFVSHTRPLTPSKAKPLGRSGFRPASQLVVMRAKYVSAKIFFIEMRRAAFLSKTLVKNHPAGGKRLASVSLAGTDA